MEREIASFDPILDTCLKERRTETLKSSIFDLKWILLARDLQFNHSMMNTKTLSQALLALTLISPLSSLADDMKTGQFVKCPEAISKHIEHVIHKRTYNEIPTFTCMTGEVDGKRTYHALVSKTIDGYHGTSAETFDETGALLKSFGLFKRSESDKDFDNLSYHGENYDFYFEADGMAVFFETNSYRSVRSEDKQPIHIKNVAFYDIKTRAHLSQFMIIEQDQQMMIPSEIVSFSKGHFEISVDKGTIKVNPRVSLDDLAAQYIKQKALDLLKTNKVKPKDLETEYQALLSQFKENKPKKFHKFAVELFARHYSESDIAEDEKEFGDYMKKLQPERKYKYSKVHSDVLDLYADQMASHLALRPEDAFDENKMSFRLYKKTEITLTNTDHVIVPYQIMGFGNQSVVGFPGYEFIQKNHLNPWVSFEPKE